MQPTNSSVRRNSYLASMPEWKRDLARPIHKATYSAAVGLSDDEIEAVVKHALLRARKDLSS